MLGRLGLGLPIASAVVLAFVLAGPLAAASSQEPETFAQLVAAAKLVALVSVAGDSDTGFVLTVEQVLKGQAGPRLAYPGPQPITALEPGWSEVVIAFDDPTTLDFRAGTTVWHVGPDGRIDPEGYQQLPGLPPTLTALLAYFASPGPSTAGTTSPCGSVAGTTSPCGSGATTGPGGSGAGTTGPGGSALPLAVALLAVCVSLLVAWRLVIRSKRLRPRE